MALLVRNYFIANATKLQYLQLRNSSVFGINEIARREKPENFAVHQVGSKDHDMATDFIKKYYLKEHVLVRARNVDLTNDQAIAEYIKTLIKQGNSMYLKSTDGRTTGVCINYAASPVDPPNLRNYAFYRQDPNTKDFLYFIAKLQETPNLWKMFNQPKVFEVKMLTVLPEFRRQGLATLLAEKSMSLAEDLGYKVVRMDCINKYDYKVAERCMLRCLLRFPLHKLRSNTAPFVKRSSEYNKYVRVYVHAHTQPELPHMSMKPNDLENMIE